MKIDDLLKSIKKRFFGGDSRSVLVASEEMQHSRRMISRQHMLMYPEVLAYAALHETNEVVRELLAFSSAEPYGTWLLVVSRKLGQEGMNFEGMVVKIESSLVKVEVKEDENT